MKVPDNKQVIWPCGIGEGKNFDVCTHVGITSLIEGILLCLCCKIGTTAAVNVVIAIDFLAAKSSRARAAFAVKLFQPGVPISNR